MRRADCTLALGRLQRLHTLQPPAAPSSPLAHLLLTLSLIPPHCRCLGDLRDVHGKLCGVVTAAAQCDDPGQGASIVAEELSLARGALLELYPAYARGHASAVTALKSAGSTRPELEAALNRCAAAAVEGSDWLRALGKGDGALAPLLELPLAHSGALGSLLGDLASACFAAGDDPAVTQSLADASALFRSVVAEAEAEGGWTSSASASSTSVAADLSARLQQAAGGVPATPGAHAHTSGSFVDGVGGSPFSAPPPPPGAAAHQMGATSGASAMLGALSGSSGSDGVLSAAMPPPPPPAVGDVPIISADAVLAAQAQADEAARRLEALEREVALKESEMSLAQREVARAAAGGGVPGAALSAGPGPLEEAIRRLGDEERALLSRLSSSENRALFEAFLARKAQLEEEETRL